MITKEDIQQEYLTVSEAAQALEVNNSRIRQICIEGRFEGAFKRGGSWFIPRKAVEIYKPLTPGPRPGHPPGPKIMTDREIMNIAINQAANLKEGTHHD